jgi:hypothetical protein
MAPERELGIEQRLEGGQALFLQRCRRRSQRLLGRELAERRAAPERERIAQQRRRGGRGPAAGIADQRAEAVGIDDRVGSVEQIAAVLRHDALRADRLAQPRHLQIERVHRIARRALRPQRLREHVARHAPPPPCQQQRQQQPLLSTSDRHGPPTVVHLQRSQDPELHFLSRSLTSGRGRRERFARGA